MVPSGIAPCALSHALRERDLIGRVLALAKMGGRIEMCAPVLGRREVVGGVVPAARRALRRDDGKVKGLRRRPVDGGRVERIAEIDPVPLGETRGEGWLARRDEQQQGKSDRQATHVVSGEPSWVASVRRFVKVATMKSILVVAACGPPNPCSGHQFDRLRRYSLPYAGHWVVARGDTLTFPAAPGMSDRFRLGDITLDTTTVVVGRECVFRGRIVF